MPRVPIEEAPVRPSETVDGEKEPSKTISDFEAKFGQMDQDKSVALANEMEEVLGESGGKDMVNFRDGLSDEEFVLASGIVVFQKRFRRYLYLKEHGKELEDGDRESLEESLKLSLKRVVRSDMENMDPESSRKDLSRRFLFDLVMRRGKESGHDIFERMPVYVKSKPKKKWFGKSEISQEQWREKWTPAHESLMEKIDSFRKEIETDEEEGVK